MLARTFLKCCSLAIIAGWALTLSGCAQGIDGSARELFAPAQGYTLEPGPFSYRNTTAVTIDSPANLVAAINSEVVIVSTSYGPDGRQQGGRRVEWLLSQGGVGEFVTLGDRDETSFGHSVRNLPHKVNNSYAVGESSPIPVLITRGTPTRSDDVALAVGQTWVSVTSPVEGTSYVTAFGPDVHNWDRRRASATISWIDAKWNPPKPAILKLGDKQILTTTVTRQSDGTPLVGWRVRYEILGQPVGTPAATPDGSQVIEVTTNESGIANAEIGQPSPTTASVLVNVQLFRPSDPANPNSKRVLIGSTNTQVTWVDSPPAVTPSNPISPPSGPGTGSTVPPNTGTTLPAVSPNLELKIDPPDQPVPVGQEAVFTLNVKNISNEPARGLYLKDSYDNGLQFKDGANPIERDVPEIPPGKTWRSNLRFTVLRPGSLCHIAEVGDRKGQKVSATACVQGVAAAQANSFSVKVTGKAQTIVGSPEVYNTVVTNTGTQKIPSLKLVTTPDAALKLSRASPGRDEAEDYNKHFVWKITDLDPGKQVVLQVEVIGQAPANGLLIRSDVTDDSGAAQSDQIRFDVAAAAAPAANDSPLKVTIIADKEPVQVGSDVKYSIQIQNTGSASEFNVQTQVTLPPELRDTGRSGNSVPVGQNVFRYSPVQEIKPNEAIGYEITARAVAAKETQINVQALSQGHPTPVQANRSTTIFADGGN